MSKPNPVVKHFDKFFLLIALLISAGWIYFSMQKPFNLKESQIIEEKLQKISNRKRLGGDDLELKGTYNNNFSTFKEAMGEDKEGVCAKGWVSYLTPTAIPFKKVVATPPPKLRHDLSAPTAVLAKSVPGKVRIEWKAPEISQNVLFQGYYVFRIDGEKEFGSYLLEGKLKVVLGAGATTETPLAGPIGDTFFDDKTVREDTAYKYVVMCYGFPGRKAMENGKEKLDSNGQPVIEAVSDQPIAEVSQVLQGRTVEEMQIFLKGTMSGVAGIFVIHKWDREDNEWLTESFPYIPIGKQIGGIKKHGGKETDFSTQWVLSKIGSESVEIEGKERNLAFALLVNMADPSRTRKLFATKKRDVVLSESQFALVVPEGDLKKK